MPKPYSTASHSPDLPDVNKKTAKYSSRSEPYSQYEKWSQEGVGESRDIALGILRDCIDNEETVLDLSELGLSTLPIILPAHVTTILLRGNHLKHLPENLPADLSVLDVSYNPGLRSTNFPKNLKRLIAKNIELEFLPRLPNTLKYCEIENNLLRDLPPLPESLRYLNAIYNNLSHLPQLPPRLSSCIVGDNSLTEIPDIPPYIDEFDVSNNELLIIPELPPFLRFFCARGNLLR